MIGDAMAASSGLTHVAMSVPEGMLTDDYRAKVLQFYGRVLGWREMESLRLPDRLTVGVGPTSYINLREQSSPPPVVGSDEESG